MTFDGQGDPSSVFIVQIASTLVTATASHVNAINGAQACHIFWQVGSSATLGTASTFQGTILASTSVSVTTSAHVKGRALAGTGAVTLDNNIFTSPDCANTTPPSAAAATTTTVTVASSATSGTPVTIGATVTSSTGSTTGTVSFYSNGALIGTATLDSSGRGRIKVTAGGPVRSGTIVAVYNGSPNSAPSTSAARRFVVTAVVATPTRVAASTQATAAATSTSAGLAVTGPTSAVPLTRLGTGAVLFGVLLMLASRTRYAGTRRH